MHDVGVLERDRDVAAGVRRTVVARRHRLLSNRRLPVLVERRVGVRLVVLALCVAACFFCKPGHVDVRDDLADVRLHHLVAAGVVRVMVRVDQEVDLPRRLRLQSFEEHRRRVGELAVHDHHGVGVTR